MVIFGNFWSLNAEEPQMRNSSITLAAFYAHKKMFNITNHQRNTNQNQNETLPYNCQNGYLLKEQVWQMLESIWKKQNLCTLFMGMLTGAATVKQCMDVSRKTKNRTIIWPRNSTPGFIFEKAKNINLKRCKHPSVHSMILDNGQDMAATCSSIDEYDVCVCVCTCTHTHTHTGILLSHKK